MSKMSKMSKMSDKRPYTYVDFEAGIVDCETRDGRVTRVLKYMPEASAGTRLLADVDGFVVVPYYDNGQLWQGTENQNDLFLRFNESRPYTQNDLEAGITEAWTRDGRRVTGLKRVDSSAWPIVGRCGEQVHIWHTDGKFTSDSNTQAYDLRLRREEPETEDLKRQVQENYEARQQLFREMEKLHVKSRTALDAFRTALERQKTKEIAAPKTLSKSTQEIRRICDALNAAYAYNAADVHATRETYETAKQAGRAAPKETETMTPYTKDHFLAGIKEARTRDGQDARILVYEPGNGEAYQLVGITHGQAAGWRDTGRYSQNEDDYDLFLKTKTHRAMVLCFNDGSAMVSPDLESGFTGLVKRIPIEWES